MSLSWILLPAFLFTSLVLSHGAEHGVPQGKRRTQASAGGSNVLQHPPPPGPRGRGHGRDHGGQGGQGGLLSRRPLHPLARPEDDGTGLEGLSPVRLEMGPGRDRARMTLRNPSQVRENNHLGTRKGRGHRQGDGPRHGHGHFEHRRQGGRRNHGRHRGEISLDLDSEKNLF